MLKQRIITAVILAPLALAAVFFLPLAGFATFVAIAFLLGAWEWGSFCGLQHSAKRWGFVALMAAILLCLYWLLPVGLNWPYTSSALILAVLACGLLWWGLAVALVVSFPASQSLWSERLWLRALMGLLTLVPAWLGLVLVRSVGIETNPYTGAWLICGLLALVWAADIGGYLVGKPFGRTKLMPKVSPGKTIEGMLGGLLMVFALLAVFCWYLDWPTQSPVLFVAAFVLTTLSVFGDLTESMLKRVAGVKDSGRMLPGHGGILDRIDSLTATAPLYAFLVALLGGFY